MAANVTASVEQEQEQEFNNWVRLVIEARVNLLKQMICDGIHIVSGAALATYTWRMNFNPIYPIVCSTIGAVGVLGLCINMKHYLRKSLNVLTEGIGSKWYLATGTITYFSNVYALREALKRSSAVWKSCFCVAAFGYCLAASSMSTLLGREVLNRKPYLKCCQLLFGPTLIASGGCYLMSHRQHDEKLLLFLTWISSLLVGNHIGHVGGRRFESNEEPKWQLFRASELFLGGSILCASGASLVVHSLKNEYRLIITIFGFVLLIGGISDIYSSIIDVKEYVGMEDVVFNGICGMIAGPVIFLSTCIGVKYVQHPARVPAFFFASGISIVLFWRSIADLFRHLPLETFLAYTRWVLGPVVTAWGFLVTAYVGRHVGWKYSLVGTPFIYFGLSGTYSGFSNVDGFLQFFF